MRLLVFAATNHKSKLFTPKAFKQFDLIVSTLRPVCSCPCVPNLPNSRLFMRLSNARAPSLDCYAFAVAIKKSPIVMPGP